MIAELALLSLSAGVHSVPMYALIQLRSPATHRARIIAANNILNALFMVVSALMTGALLAAGSSIPQVFLTLALLNALVGFYIFLLVPEYLLRFVAFLLTRVIHRFSVRGDEHIPREGAAILVCNHVGFVDAMLLMAASPRPIRFVMDHRTFAIPVLGWMFRLAKAIPIAPQREDPAAYERAFAQVRAVPDEGELPAIFPEGAITHDGTLGEFKGGVMKILATHPVPVVPLALHNLWGQLLLVRRRRARDAPALPARAVQSGEPVRRGGAAGGGGGDARGAARAGGGVAGGLNRRAVGRLFDCAHRQLAEELAWRQPHRGGRDVRGARVLTQRSIRSDQGDAAVRASGHGWRGQPAHTRRHVALDHAGRPHDD